MTPCYSRIRSPGEQSPLNPSYPSNLSNLSLEIIYFITYLPFTNLMIVVDSCKLVFDGMYIFREAFSQSNTWKHLLRLMPNVTVPVSVPTEAKPSFLLTYPSSNWTKGRVRLPNRINFCDKFQRAFDAPHPLIFGKLYCNFLLQIWLHI